MEININLKKIAYIVILYFVIIFAFCFAMNLLSSVFVYLKSSIFIVNIGWGVFFKYLKISFALSIAFGILHWYFEFRNK